MSSFQQTYLQLNNKQKQAVDTIEGPVMVIAGPGTGKTQILTLRIANILLKTQVNPENILALTFTENAASEMKERLSNLIGPDAYKVHIHTFHSFCNELIQKYFDIFQHLASYLPVSDLEEVQMIKEIIETEQLPLLRPQGDPAYYYHPIRNVIGSLKKEGITPAHYTAAVEEWNAAFSKRDDLFHIKGKYKGKMKGEAITEQKHIEKANEFAHVFTIYQKKLSEKKLYDFNDMIMEVVDALKRNEQFLFLMRETYQYILVDEHQDTNNAQNAIIEQLCGIDDFPNLFVVGDEKQSIFRFQGASLENFLYFKSVFPRATLIRLEDNYRSTQIILDSVGALIQNNIQTITGDMSLTARSSTKNEPILLTQYANPFQELSHIALRISDLHTRGISYDQIAIIVRKNSDVLTCGQTLANYDIPYVVSTDESLFEDHFIQKIITLLRTINHVGDEVYLARILLMDIFENDALSVFQVIQDAHRKKIDLWTFIQTIRESNSLKQTVQSLLRWKKCGENKPMDEFFVNLLSESGLRDRILTNAHSLTLLGKIQVLYEDIKELQRKNHMLTLSSYIEYIDLLEEHVLSPHVQIDRPKAGSVFISTAHKAKGLEFDSVFIPLVTDSYWGNNKSSRTLIHVPWSNLSRVKIKSSKESQVEEERRLFYVALTRAKQHIFLSFSSHTEDGKDQNPSRFLMEIPEKKIQKTTLNEPPEEEKERLIQTLTPKKQNSKTFKKKDIQAYVRALFVTNGISVSALNNFLTCPWKYIFRNLIRLPDVRGYSLLLGTAVHETIRKYIFERKKNVHLTEHALLEYFKESIKNYSASEQDLKALEEKGTKIIQTYFQKRMVNWDDNRDSEIIIPNIYLEEDISINGKIDMIEYGKNNEVVVYDFKTGKARSRNELIGNTKKENKDYYRQLVFYKLLLSLYKKGQYKMTRGIIEFVESGLDGEIISESFSGEESDLKELIQNIRDMKKSILNLSFWDTTCDDIKCEYCKLRSHFYRPLE